jgi:hypothetical protein
MAMNRIWIARTWVILVALVSGSSRVSRASEPKSLWAADCLTKVMRSETPGEGTAAAMELSGARGETVSGQAVFRPTGDVPAATVQITDLRHKTSDTVLPADAVKLQWVRYIDIDRNTKGVPDEELVAKAPASIPDPYWEAQSIWVKANQAQPVWLEVRVPYTAPAGDYIAVLRVTGGPEHAELPVGLHVWDFDMPKERHLSVVNWWRFPGLGFEDRVTPYSDEYWRLLGRFCAFLVDHRQTDVQASIDLIQETRNTDGSYSYNTSRLERYAEAAFEAGIRQIQLHSVGRRIKGHTDPDGRIEARPEQFRRLAELEKVIVGRGWQRRFTVSICDEPFIYHEESYSALVDRVHQTAPHVRIIEAVEAEYFGKLDIYVPKLSHLNLWYPRFDRARRDGAELWYYTCCHPVGRYPNRFLDQPLIKARVLHWINYLYGLDGFLHWGLNHYAGDNAYTQEGISKGLPLGDRAVVYPGREGLIGSLRFSAQRDGLQDFEYLWVLESRLAEIKKTVGEEAFWLDPRQRPLELCRRVVWSFHDYTRDPNVLMQTRRRIAEEIEALRTPPLLVVQTSPPEGTVVPAGPRNIGIRGLVPPGATVKLNGKSIGGVRPSGYFVHAYFMPDDKPTITLTVESQGKNRSVQRTFKLAD